MGKPTKLEIYLEAIRRCPDELVELGADQNSRKVPRLTAEFGISDYWPIYLRHPRKEMLRFLIDCRRYGQVPSEKVEQKLGEVFACPGEKRVGIQVAPDINSLDTSDEEKRLAKEHYDLGMVVFADEPLEGEDAVEPRRIMARAIGNIGRWISTQSISAMFPITRGEKYSRRDIPEPLVIHRRGRKNDRLSSHVLRANPWLPTVEELVLAQAN